MALFGAPVAQEDHAVRACDAAVSMHEGVGRLAEGMRSRLGADIKIRIGVHSGDVALRVIGNEVRIDYAAIPETTRVAARTVQAARPGSSLITAETLRLAEGFIEVTPAAAANVYELSAPSVVRSRLSAAIARSLSQFVGRDAEIEKIGTVLDRARSGRGQVVALVGEPGVGKSRLVYEFTHSHRTHDWRVLKAGALSYGKATSYLPVIELLKGYFNITERETHREIREKVTGKLLTLDRALGPILPAVLTLLDAPIEDRQWQALDPPQRRERILEGVKHLLLRESRNQPVLVVLEDLQWVDAETQAFLDRLVETLPTARLFLVVSYGPEYDQRWAHKTYYTSLRIDPLDRESAAKLLQDVLGSDPSLHEFRSVLIERTEGNPFFIEEIVRTLAETHVIVGERGRYRLGETMAAIQVPSTVRAVLAARIYRLSLEDKRLLQSASIIGKDVPFVLLQAIAEAGPDELHTSLRSLQAAEFLYEARLFPNLEYTFKHALTHEVAYGSLLQDRRRTLHGRVLDAIENHHGHRLTEHIEALGYHALRSERWDKAVVYLRLAGEKARGRWAHPQAIDYLEQALRALAHLPDTADWQRTSIDLRLELRHSFYATGDRQRSITNLDAAERSATAIGDARRLAWVLVYQGDDARFAGELSRARTCLDRARSLAAGTNDQVLRALVAQYTGVVLHVFGEYRESIQCLRASAHIRRDLDRSAREWASPVSGRAEGVRVIAQAWLARSLAIVGEFEEGIALGRDALAAADCIENLYAALQAALSLGDIHRQRGDWIPATEALERAQHITAERKFRVETPLVESRLGVVYVATGHTARGLTLLRNAVANIGTATKDVRYSLAIRLLGEGCALAGDTAEARHCAKEAIAVARTLGLRGNEALAEWLLAHVCDAIGETQNAQQGFEASLIQASALGMRPLVAHCHRGLGKLYRRMGKQEQAHEHFTTATTMYREMGMTYWLARTEAEESELA